jgi:hypothetical protein
VGDSVRVKYRYTVDDKGVHWISPEYNSDKPKVVNDTTDMWIVDFGPADCNALCQTHLNSDSRKSAMRQLWIPMKMLKHHKVW